MSSRFRGTSTSGLRLVDRCCCSTGFCWFGTLSDNRLSPPTSSLSNTFPYELVTIILEGPIYFSESICDNHGRLPIPGISSSMRGVFTLFAFREAIRAMVLFLGACTFTMTERTCAGALEGTSARKGFARVIPHFQCWREYCFERSRKGDR